MPPSRTARLAVTTFSANRLADAPFPPAYARKLKESPALPIRLAAPVTPTAGLATAAANATSQFMLPLQMCTWTLVPLNMRRCD